MHLVLALGMSLLLAAFYIGWEVFYPTIGGSFRSETRGFLYIIYLLSMLFLTRLYKACQFGRVRVGQLIYSQVLSTALSAGMIYVIAAANARVFMNPAPLLLILFIQFLVSIVFCVAGNRLYFHLHKPKKTAVLYRDDGDLKKISEIDYFEDKFLLESYIQDPISMEDVLPRLDGCKVVFVVGVDAALRNAVAKHCIENGISAYIYPDVSDVLMMNAENMQAFSVPMVRVRHASPNPEYLLFKRVFDIAAALVGIVLTSPVMLFTALAIKAYDGGPVLYRQVRLTKDGRHFKILKFRSMRTDAEKDGVARLATSRDERITPVGHIIRACRIDELPQLFNILKGDMSIVGPRPERPEVAADYEKQLPAFNLRLQCKAGLTGYAQVYGRYNTEPEDKLKMDLMYIHNMSFLEDVKLCLYTVKILFAKESTQGIAEGQTTAAKALAQPKEKELLHL